MDNRTLTLGKHRRYQCLCGNDPCRPLRAADTTAVPFPKPCDVCGRDLADRPFVIEDTTMWWRTLRQGG